MTPTGTDHQASQASTKPVTPTPRPTFAEATHVRRSDAALHLWGDTESGEVADWVYVSSEKIHHLVFGLAPGGSFRHSESFRTVFAADEVLYVLAGAMALANPMTGEVVRAATGEAVFFRRDTWHHAFTVGSEALRVLEFFAPPPAAGASSAYSKTRPYLDKSSYTDDRWEGRWPEARAERERSATLRLLDDRLALWSLTGEGTLLGRFASTEHLTVAKVVQNPGGRSDVLQHGGDASLHVTSGVVNIAVHTDERRSWFEVPQDDGFFVPQGTRYEFRNMTGSDCELMLAVAPTFAASRQA